MAARGATAQQIRQATGVTAQAAQNIVSRAASSAPTAAAKPTTQAPGPYNATNMPMSTSAPTAGPLSTGYVVPAAGQSTNAYAAPATQPTQQNLGTLMANGKISNQEIKDIAKGKENPNAAYMRIADRLSTRGGMLGQGVLRGYTKRFEKQNPMAALVNLGDTQGDFYSAFTGGGGKKKASQAEFYRNALGILGSKDYMKGDVFGRMRSGEFTPRTLSNPLAINNTQSEKQVIKNPVGGVGSYDIPKDTTTTPEEVTPAVTETTPTTMDTNLQDPFAVSGMATWRPNKKGKGKGIRSTAVASRGSRSGITSKTLATT